MRSLRFLFGVILVLAICAVSASAACRVQRRAVVVQDAVVVNVIPVVQFQTLAYGVGYDPTAQELRALRKEIAELRGQLRGGAEGIHAPEVVEGEHVKLMEVRCAKCHSDSTVGGAKGGFAMFQKGKLRQLSADEVLNVQAATMTERMPKGERPLTDQEFTALLAGLLNSRQVGK